MASARTKFSVGLFLLLGVFLVIVGIIWLGMFDYLEKGRLFAAYFDESVQGLDKDSPVKYRGVSIGRVDNIAVAPDQNLIQVILKIEKGFKPQNRIDEITAQLKSVGITGLMFIELDRVKDGDPDLSPKLAFRTEYPVIRTRPSEITKIFQSIDEVFRIFKEIDFQTLSKQMISVLQKIDGAVDDANIKGVSAQLELAMKSFEELTDSPQLTSIPASVVETAASIKQTAETADQAISVLQELIITIEKITDDSKPGISQSIDNLNQIMHIIRQTLADGSTYMDGTFEKVGDLERQMSVMASRVDSLVENLNVLIDSISNQPSQLLLGEPPKEKELESYP